VVRAVSFGYKTVDDYYFDASSSRSIKDVRVPLLCIQVLYSVSRDRCNVASNCLDN
jgi:predicted alpha/beta-fold hydrolase